MIQRKPYHEGMPLHLSWVFYAVEENLLIPKNPLGSVWWVIKGVTSDTIEEMSELSFPSR